MKKLMASLLVSGLVISGVGIYHVEAASGNTSQTVEQLTHGQKNIEDVNIGESINKVTKKYGTPIYSKEPSGKEHYYEYRTSKGVLVVTANGQKDHGYVTRISMTYNKADGPTYKHVKHLVGNKAIARVQYNSVSGNFGYIENGKTTYQFASNSPKDKNIKLYRIDIAK
ncbi:MULTISPECIES: SA0570 family protein [Staphylococcus]|uniref:SA0570 family protein n=1 Tax=Staphylococcus TaxID=1279 RepID=UPI00076B3156|nr:MULTISPECIES: hypothetical protein [Staphylococcus]AMG64711.1 hypothetical protein AL501_10825 [Staphylococcus lugdunensis]MCI2813882.1 hypothetical protein [Staphylococcus lugdunensis]MDU0965682.1 hypothetical protein [Staphylococcus lugdunensis]MDU1964315.1 hypothetical protein [Staphylococcus lugdunensis]MDU2321129.1 hypothetical protein [Staphylococcus lugdunensis]